MSKMRNTEITVKRGFRYTCYVSTATQNFAILVYRNVHMLCTYQGAKMKFRLLDDFWPDYVALT